MTRTELKDVARSLQVKVGDIITLAKEEREVDLAYWQWLYDVKAKALRRMGGTWVKLKYRSRFENGDEDMIPGLDEVAEDMREDGIRGTAHLFGILKDNVPPRPLIADFYGRAVDIIEAGAKGRSEVEDVVPF